MLGETTGSYFLWWSWCIYHIAPEMGDY